jgi:hypothetical protein
MPFVHPDVVKLDMRLLHRPDLPQTAQVVNAVVAHAERTGALIVAEGIEREQHLGQARSMGATLGQGWLLGHPGALPQPRAGTGRAGSRRPIETLAPGDAGADGRTPFDIVAGTRAPAHITKRALLTTTRYLESKAADTADPPVVLACFQDARRFGPATAHRYALLAKQSPLVAAFGVGLDHEPAPGVRGAALAPDDPLRREWAVVVVGPYFSAALVARDLGDGGADRYRRFDYALTYERAVVIEAARALLRRLGPAA